MGLEKKMTPRSAAAIAKLLNLQNRLVRNYTALDVLDKADQYVVKYTDAGEVVGVAEAELIQWYQCEIRHVSVSPAASHRGIGTWLVAEAEKRARTLGARITQCTIRVGNVESEGLFKKCGYAPSVTFDNVRTRNKVTVYVKVLTDQGGM